MSVRAVLATLVGAMALAATSHASAEGTVAERCIAAADKGQLLRDEGKLKASRVELATCGADACPVVIRRECVRWLEEVDTRIPTAIVTARDGAGRDLPHARLLVDGQVVPPERVGRSLQLDPGPHTLRAEAEGRASQESFILQEGERDRVVPVILRAPDELTRYEKRVPLVSWVLGGVAVAGAVGFGVFWAKGMAEVSDLRASCSPYCTSSEVDEVRPSLNIARISGGVAIGAAAAAVAFYVFSSPKPVPRKTGASLAPNGVVVSF